MNLDAIAYAVNVENQGSNLVDAHALGVSELTVGSVFNFPATGSLDIGGDVYEYTAVDDETNTIALSGVTTAAYDDDARVELSPAFPVWFATVVVGSDQPGFNAMVPIHLVSMLADDAGGSVFPDGIPVILESINAGEYEWQVVAAPGRQPQHNATTTPIVVSNADGESATISAPGFQTHTNDPVPVWSLVVDAVVKASDGSDLYAINGSSSGTIRKFDAVTGVENTSGFPIAGTFSDLAVDGGFIYAVDFITHDVRKYDAATGVENTSGFPIVGTHASVAVDSGWVFASGFPAGNISKFDAVTGVENTSGFPISGTFQTVRADAGYLYPTESGDVCKFDAATGVEETTGFPLVGTFTIAAPEGAAVYALDSSGVRKFDAVTGEEDTTAFPIAEEFWTVTTDAAALYATRLRLVRSFNLAEGFNSTTVNSSNGSARFHDTRVSDLTVDGDSSFAGPVNGPMSVPLLGHSDQKTLAVGVTPTSTTNINMPDLTLTFNVSSTSDVVWVALNTSVTITTAGTVNIVEMLLDGVADAAQLITRAPAGPQILAGRQDWRLTGLAAGSHTCTFRTRNTAAATNASVNGTHTRSSYWTST